MGRDLTPFILQATTPNASGELVLNRPALCADITLRTIDEAASEFLSDRLEALVTDFYQAALVRSPSGVELAAAVSDLTDASVELSTFIVAAGAVAKTLLTSAEYIARARTDTQFIEDCYQTFLGRASDASGLAHWVAALASTTRAQMTDNFIYSLEFRVRMQSVLRAETAIIMRLATAAIVVTSESTLAMDGANVVAISQPVGAISYTARITEVGDLRFSKGSAPDGGSLTLSNLDYTFTEIVGALDDALDGAQVRLSLCFRKSDGTYEAESLLDGVLSDPKGDTKKCTVNVMPDTATPNALVAWMEVTQHCINEFGGPGCMHKAHDPGATCSKVKEDAVAGCRFWQWEHAFRGAPTQLESDPTFTRTESIAPRPSGGWDPDGYPNPRRWFDPDRIQFDV